MKRKPKRFGGVSAGIYLGLHKLCSFVVLLGIEPLGVLNRLTLTQCWDKSLIHCTVKLCPGHQVQPTIFSKSFLSFYQLALHFAISKMFV